MGVICKKRSDGQSLLEGLGKDRHVYDHFTCPA